MASPVGFSPVNTQRYFTQAAESQAVSQAPVKAPAKAPQQATPEPQSGQAVAERNPARDGVGGGVLMLIIGLTRSFFRRE